MQFDRRAKGAWVALVALGALTLAFTTGGAAASNDASVAAKGKGNKGNCTEAKNVEAIIDDSGSMSGSDPDVLGDSFRTKFLNAFANIGANNGLIFGGIEFGTATDPLFGPAAIPGVIPAMQASFLKVQADSGGTDYQAAFAGGNAHNGTADARIFLTDGFPNDPNFTSHLSPPTKTYAIGLGQGFATSPDAQTVLGAITASTGAPAPFLIADPSQIQPVAGAITAAIHCKGVPQTFTDTFTTQGQKASHKFKPKGKTADVFTSWGTLGVTISQLNFTQTVGGKTVAKGSVALKAAPRKGGKTRRVKASKTSGATFASAKLKGLKKGGKVKISLKASTLPTPTVATTQVIK